MYFVEIHMHYEFFGRILIWVGFGLRYCWVEVLFFLILYILLKSLWFMGSLDIKRCWGILGGSCCRDGRGKVLFILVSHACVFY